MSFVDTLKSDLDALNQKVQTTEAWVVNEIAKGWHLLQTVGHTVQVDILAIFQWIQSHQVQIIAALKNAMGAITMVSALATPGGTAAAAVNVALTAINAATAATNVLGKAIVSGTTPLSTAVDAFHAVKSAQSAVNDVIKAATAQPATFTGNAVAAAA